MPCVMYFAPLPERGISGKGRKIAREGEKSMRWPGIEPGSNAWKASMLTITPPTLESDPVYFEYNSRPRK